MKILRLSSLQERLTGPLKMTFSTSPAGMTAMVYSISPLEETRRTLDDAGAF